MNWCRLPPKELMAHPGHVIALTTSACHRIEPFQFDARIRRAKLPADRADSLVAVILPALHLLTQFLNGGNVVRQALLRQHREFDLSNVEPTRVLRGVMNLQPIREALACSGGKTP
jgi:hypothetical protein